MYHRAPAFVEIYARCLDRLKQVFQTENDVLCFASSGSGGMESAVANLVAAGQPALVASCGKFGERWVELCQAFGAELVHHDAGWGHKVEPAELDRLLSENPSVEVAFTTLSETSTGVVNDVAALAEVARSHDVLLVGRRGLGPRRSADPPGRVGRRRGRLGLAEGAHVPARPRLRQCLRARARLRGRRSRRPLLLRLGEDGEGPAQGPAGQPVHPGGHALPRSGRRAGHDPRGGGSRARVRPSPAARPRGARRRRRARARPASAPRTRTPTWSPR